jgi:hypothetical protein
MSYYSIPIIVIMEPATLIIKPFGLSGAWFVNDKTGGPAIFPLCLIIITDILLAFLLGTLIGLFQKYIYKKRNL